MKTLYKTLLLIAILSINYLSAQTIKVYLTVSGGSYGSEKWVSITTGDNGSGTVVWAQGNGTIGNGAGFLTDREITVPCGATLYLNAYDKYDDGWDGTKYALRTAPAGGGTLIINNSDISPNDGSDTDPTSAWDGTNSELETSEAFSVDCPCEATLGNLSATCSSGVFSVSLTISDPGAGGSSLVVNDGGIHPNQTVSSFPSTVNFGPYTAGSSVTLNVDNGTCSINSNTVLENCPVGFSCTNAEEITSGYTSSSAIITPGNDGIENWVTSAEASCGEASNNGFINSDVKVFSYKTGAVAGESMYFTISHDASLHGEHSIGIFASCTGTSLTNCVASTYKFDDVLGLCATNLEANTTYYIAVAKEWYSIDGEGLNFKVVDFLVETSNTIPSDECSSAATINVSEPYTGSTRCSYSASAGSPSTFPNSCGSIENDSWMKFVAGSSDVEIEYEVSLCTQDDGVQFAVFAGECNSLTMLNGSCINYASNNSSGTWIFSGLTVGATYYIRTDGYAGDLCQYSFNPISGVVILPIEMISFEAQAFGNALNKISWSTLSESNTDYFSVEKSQNGKDFVSIEKIQAAGNSSQKLHYQVFDKAENGLLNYYRIKTVDRDGKFYYSEIKAISNKSSEEITIYPNPSKDGIFNLINNSESDFEKISVYSNDGKMIYESELNSTNTLDLSMLQSGTYIAQFSTKYSIVTKKISVE
jgi:hypothetical protein